MSVLPEYIIGCQIQNNYKYGYNTPQFTEYEIFQNCKEQLDAIDFSRLHFIGDFGFVEFCMNYRQYMIVEYLLEGYHNNDDTFLTRRNPIDTQSFSLICGYLNYAIDEIYDIDFVEICLKYVIDINELNRKNYTYLYMAKHPENKDLSLEIIELLEMHGAHEYIRLPHC